MVHSLLALSRNNCERTDNYNYSHHGQDLVQVEMAQVRYVVQSTVHDSPEKNTSAWEEDSIDYLFVGGWIHWSIFVLTTT